MIIDCAHYTTEGRRERARLSLEQAADCAHGADGFVWVGVHDPTASEMAELQERFDLHELAVEDASNKHQRPKIEEYESGYFVVFRTARYHDDLEEVEFGEVHLFLGAHFAISVRHGEASELSRARALLEERPELIEAGPAAVVWAVLDVVVDDYLPVLEGLDDDIAQIEEAVFAGKDDQTQRIYRLKREVVDVFRAVHPLLAPLTTLEEGRTVRLHPDIAPFFRDVTDHVLRVHDEIVAQRETLNSILQANATTIALRQNDVVRKVSGWAGIITVPTLIASIYGMNFTHMPELSWKVGYPGALAVMGLAAGLLYRYFKRAGWL